VDGYQCFRGTQVYPEAGGSILHGNWTTLCHNPKINLLEGHQHNTLVVNEFYFSKLTNPFRSSCLEKFSQPGCEGILIPTEPLSELFCLKSWCKKGIKLKIFLKLFLCIFYHPVYFLCSFDGPTAFFGCIITHMHHPKYLQKANSTLHHQKILSVLSTH
jgi:hypothetical protein